VRTHRSGQSHRQARPARLDSPDDDLQRLAYAKTRQRCRDNALLQITPNAKVEVCEIKEKDDHAVVITTVELVSGPTAQPNTKPKFRRMLSSDAMISLNDRINNIPNLDNPLDALLRIDEQIAEVQKKYLFIKTKRHQPIPRGIWLRQQAKRAYKKILSAQKTLRIEEYHTLNADRNLDTRDRSQEAFICRKLRWIRNTLP
jgi:hypothetical protein